MKWSIFKYALIVLLLLIISTYAKAERTSLELSQERRSKWEKLIPDYHKLQYAGSMGFLSVGTGWAYGKHNNWETEILLGFVPRYRTEDISLTATLKQNYIPFHLDLDKKRNGKWVLAPLTASIYFNKIFGEHFWTELPERYPEKYGSITFGMGNSSKCLSLQDANIRHIHTSFRTSESLVCREG